MPFYEAFLTPQGIIIEAEDEEHLKMKLKAISVSGFIFDQRQVPKDEIIKELKKRHIYINLD